MVKQTRAQTCDNRTRSPQTPAMFIPVVTTYSVAQESLRQHTPDIMTTMEVVEALDLHCTCIRGPSWEESGHGDQDGGFGSYGTVTPPTLQDIKCWFDGVISGSHGGHKLNNLHYGGRWIDRSVVVSWVGDGSIFYYQAGDAGKHDLFKAGKWFQQPITTVINDVHEVKVMCFAVTDEYLKFKAGYEGVGERISTIQYLRGQFVATVTSKIQKLLAEHPPLASCTTYSSNRLRLALRGHDRNVEKDIAEEKKKRKKVKKVKKSL